MVLSVLNRDDVLNVVKSFYMRHSLYMSLLKEARRRETSVNKVVCAILQDFVQSLESEEAASPRRRLKMKLKRSNGHGRGE